MAASKTTKTAATAVRLRGPAAARYIGWSPQTLVNKRSKARNGLLPDDAVPPVYSSTGNSTYYLVSDLDAWLAAQAGDALPMRSFGGAA